MLYIFVEKNSFLALIKHNKPMSGGVLRIIKNSGTEDPFNARLMFGIFDLRDKMVKNNEQDRLQFDKLYTPILETLEETQEAINTLKSIIVDHKAKVENGEIIEFQGDTIQINETIDRDLKKNFKDFFVKGNRAVKRLVPLFKLYGYSFSFQFQKDKQFISGKKKFLTKHQGEKHINFLNMIENDRRSWLSSFIEIRRKIEHEGFSLPAIQYIKHTNGTIVALFPTIDNIDLINFIDYFWQNLFEFIEDCVVSLIGFNLEKPWMIISVPEEKRDKSMPLKYRPWVEGLTDFLIKEQTKNNQSE